jgi:hypothetical protein
VKLGHILNRVHNPFGLNYTPGAFFNSWPFYCRHSLPAVFVDEKTGVQAIHNIAPDLPQKSGKHNNVGRDCEYNKTC